MELHSIKALKKFQSNQNRNLQTQYVKTGITEWIINWKKRLEDCK